MTVSGRICLISQRLKNQLTKSDGGCRLFNCFYQMAKSEPTIQSVHKRYYTECPQKETIQCVHKRKLVVQIQTFIKYIKTEHRKKIEKQHKIRRISKFIAEKSEIKSDTTKTHSQKAKKGVCETEAVEIWVVSKRSPDVSPTSFALQQNRKQPQ